MKNKKQKKTVIKKQILPHKFPLPTMKETARERVHRGPVGVTAFRRVWRRPSGISRGGSWNDFPGACRPRMNSLSRGVPGTPTVPPPRNKAVAAGRGRPVVITQVSFFP